MTTTPDSPDTSLGYAQPRSTDLPPAPAKSGVGVPSPQTRRYLYGIALAVILLAQVARLLPGEYVDAIVNVVTAVLGVGTPALAIPNTPAAE
jgi:hypothetical protein